MPKFIKEKVKRLQTFGHSPKSCQTVIPATPMNLLKGIILGLGKKGKKSVKRPQRVF
jgi:hypothetical protein